MSLYHKYRPKTLDEMYGNEGTVEALKATLDLDDPPHAFLFDGPTGCGKTTLGRITAKMLGSVGKDFREVDSADFRGIDTVREIRKQAGFMALEGDRRVWLIDECHQLTNDAQNALLKGLEDPPSHVYWILTTTDPQKLLATIRGRCSQFTVTPLTDVEMFQLLRRVVKGEEETLRKTVYNQIVEDSFGHPRNAIQILEQVLAVEPEKRLDVAAKQAEIQSQTIELCRALNSGVGWIQVRRILTGLKGQPEERIRRAVLAYCQAILLKSENVTAAIVMEEFIEPFYETGFAGLVFACYSVVKGE